MTRIRILAGRLDFKTLLLVVASQILLSGPAFGREDPGYEKNSEPPVRHDIKVQPYATRIIKFLNDHGQGRVAAQLENDIRRGRTFFTGSGASTGPFVRHPGARPEDNYCELPALMKNISDKAPDTDRFLIGAALTVVHEYKHMGQSNPGEKPLWENPAYAHTLDVGNKWMRDAINKADSLRDAPDTPEKVRKLKELSTFISVLTKEQSTYVNDIGRLIGEGTVLTGDYDWPTVDMSHTRNLDELKKNIESFGKKWADVATEMARKSEDQLKLAQQRKEAKTKADREKAEKEKSDRLKAEKEKAEREKLARDRQKVQVVAASPVKPPKPYAVPQTRVPPPVSSGNYEKIGGWVRSSDGSVSAVTYIYDRNGRRIGTAHTHYDKHGNRTGREEYPESGAPDNTAVATVPPSPPVQTAPPPQAQSPRPPKPQAQAPQPAQPQSPPPTKPADCTQGSGAFGDDCVTITNTVSTAPKPGETAVIPIGPIQPTPAQ